MHADDAGGRDQHLIDRTADFARDFRRHRLRRLEALIARAGVGAPAVDDHGANHAAGRASARARPGPARPAPGSS